MKIGNQTQQYKNYGLIYGYTTTKPNLIGRIKTAFFSFLSGNRLKSVHGYGINRVCGIGLYFFICLIIYMVVVKW
jgi:hypothetical protein